MYIYVYICISSNIWKYMFLAITNPKCSSLLSQSIKYMTQQGSTNFAILQSRIGEHGLHDGVSLENMETMENMKYIEKIQSILFVNRITQNGKQTICPKTKCPK